MIKRHQSKILTLVAIAVVVYLLTTLNKTSDYSINEREYVGLGSGSAIGAICCTRERWYAEGYRPRLLSPPP